LFSVDWNIGLRKGEWVQDMKLVSHEPPALVCVPSSKHHSSDKLSNIWCLKTGVNLETISYMDSGIFYFPNY